MSQKKKKKEHQKMLNEVGKTNQKEFSYRRKYHRGVCAAIVVARRHPLKEKLLLFCWGGGLQRTKRKMQK